MGQFRAGSGRGGFPIVRGALARRRGAGGFRRRGIIRAEARRFLWHNFRSGRIPIFGEFPASEILQRKKR